VIGLDFGAIDARDDAELLEAARLPVDDLPDPYARPVIPADAGREPVPDWSAEQVQELLRLLSPLRLWSESAGRWIVVPASELLSRLRTSQGLWVDELQGRADAQWRSSGAYQRLLMSAESEQAAARLEREERATREARRERVATRRRAELLELGLSPRQVEAQLRKEGLDD
jgi:hypothetical protein